ncbi:MAG: beta-propeller domain-containing protein [Pyrobaculum sp.]
MRPLHLAALALLALALLCLKTAPDAAAAPAPPRNFSSYEEIWRLLEESRRLSGVVPLAREVPTQVGFSTTNIQVAGVDELDVVKTDGRIIAAAAGGGVYIVDAANFTILASIPARGAAGVFLWKDRLVVITTQFWPVLPAAGRPRALLPTSGNTTVYIYDASARLVAVVNYTGLLAGARLADGVVYLVATMPAAPHTAPKVDGVPIDPGRVYLVDKIPHVFATVAAIDLATGAHRELSLLMSSSSWIYMSHRRLYVVSTETAYESALAKTLQAFASHAEVLQLVEEGRYHTALSLVERLLAASPDSLTAVNISTASFLDHSNIHAFDIPQLRYAGGVKVPGQILDQFSIEEHRRHLVVATTAVNHTARLTTRQIEVVTCTSPNNCTTASIPHLSLELQAVGETSNNVYVISPELKIASSLTGLARGERIYAARLVDHILYLVTYRQVDPLYAIDISDVRQPKVLGYVKTPGYGEYLHPLTEDTLLAIGVEDGGLKISLFDVKNPTDMSEKASLKLSQAHSPALYDHHAVTLHPAGMLLIPIHTPHTDGIAAIDLTGGKIALKTVLNHPHATRAIYIGERIYTISPNSIKMYTDTLQEVATLELP